MDGCARDLLGSAVANLQEVLEQDRLEPTVSFEDELDRLTLAGLAAEQVLEALRRQTVHLRTRS